jgi:hypothetical protein
LGIGTRYGPIARNTDGTIPWLHIKEMDTSLVLILVVLLVCAAIGIVTTFLGLAFHHERRHHERLHGLHTHGNAHSNVGTEAHV